MVHKKRLDLKMNM